jgi:hypothetical protein
MLKSTWIKFNFIFLLVSNYGFTQTRFEFGYSFGANATTSKTIKSSNMTWGYFTPLYPRTWSNHYSIGWGTKKDKIYAGFDGGALGVIWQARIYPNKYPLDDSPDQGAVISNYSRATGFTGSTRRNTNLLKLSLLYKHTWCQKNNWQHKSILGFGWLKTNVEGGAAAHGFTGYIDSLGLVNHGLFMDRYEYFRFQNLYLTFGYQLTYKIGDRWNWNAQIMYNQGLYKMIRWHTYRTYSESLTGYTEFDEQWSFTRLSYFAFLTGVSYEIGGKSKKK